MRSTSSASRCHTTPGTPRLGATLVQMKLKMSRWSNERLLALPDCEDRRVIELQRVLAELLSLSYIGRTNLVPLIVRKQLDLALVHGHTPSFPLVLASYGVVLVIAGDRDGAQRFGEVAMQLVERPEFSEARPQTLFLHFDFIDHWRHPIRESLGPLREAINEALDKGDQEYAGWLAATLLGQSFWAGRPLGEIDALARSLVPEIRSQPGPRTICQAIQQFSLNMQGRSDDPFLVAGESGYDERETLPAARAEGDEVTLSSIATQKLGLHYWSGDYAGALDGVADEALEHIDGMAGTAFMQIIYLTESLSRINAAPKDRATRRSVKRALGLRAQLQLAMESQCAFHRPPGCAILRRGVDPAQRFGQVDDLHERGAGHAVDVLQGFVGHTVERACVITRPVMQPEFLCPDRIECHLVGLGTGSRQSLSFS